MQGRVLLLEWFRDGEAWRWVQPPIDTLAFESGLALTPLSDCTSLALGPCGAPMNVANRPNVVGNISYPKTQQQWLSPTAAMPSWGSAWASGSAFKQRGPRVSVF